MRNINSEKYNGPERREFIRLDYSTPLAYKVCKRQVIDKLLDGYISNISQAGLLCKIGQKVSAGDILWLSFDRATLIFCTEVEKRSLIYQNGIIGKVVRVEDKNGSYSVGVRFITREERNDTHIYPKVHFLEMQDKSAKNEED